MRILVYFLVILLCSCDSSRGLGEFAPQGIFIYKNKKIVLNNRGKFWLYIDGEKIEESYYHYLSGDILINIKDDFIPQVVGVKYDRKKENVIIRTISGKKYFFGKKK